MIAGTLARLAIAALIGWFLYVTFIAPPGQRTRSVAALADSVASDSRPARLAAIDDLAARGPTVARELEAVAASDDSAASDAALVALEELLWCGDDRLAG